MAETKTVNVNGVKFSITDYVLGDHSPTEEGFLVGFDSSRCTHYIFSGGPSNSWKGACRYGHIALGKVNKNDNFRAFYVSLENPEAFEMIIKAFYDTIKEMFDNGKT